MERELKQNNSELDNAEKNFDEAGDEAKDFGKEVDKAGNQSEDAGGKLKKVGKIAAEVGKAMAAAVAAIGTAAIAAGKKLWDMANYVASAGDAIDKTSQKIGISAESFQEWSYVFERSGADVNGLQNGMKKLSAVIADAADGSASAAAKLEAVGLSIDDLNGKSQDEQLSIVVAALQDMEAGAERTTAANDLLGKSAVDMAAVLNMSAEETEALKQEAHDYGMVMSNEAVAASATFEDSLTRLKGTMGGLKNRMVGELLPGITSILDGLSDLVAGNDEAGEKIKDGVSSVIGSITGMIPQVVTLITTIAGAVLENAPAIISALAEGIIGAIPELLPVVVDVILQIVTALIDLLPQIIDAGRIFEFTNLFHGQRFPIVFDKDPDYTYTGRIDVSAITKHDAYTEVSVTITAEPYKLEAAETTVSVTNSGRANLVNGAMPVTPVIKTTAETMLQFTYNGVSMTVGLSEGEHVVPQLTLEANSTIRVTVASTGTTTFAYRKGWL